MQNNEQENTLIIEQERLRKSEQKMKIFNINKNHIQGFIAGVLVSAILFTGLVAGLNPSFLTGSIYTASDLTVEEIDTVYFLKSDSMQLKKASNATENVKHIPSSTHYGFEGIDILIEGSAGEKYTLVFGVSSSDLTNKMTLVGVPRPNPSVEWIPIVGIEIISAHEYGEFYTSSPRGAVVKYKKSGVSTIIDSREFRQASGIVIDFPGIGSHDVYHIFYVVLTGGYDGSIKTLKVLCHNKSITL
ncbi:MAG: hypothetical protein BWY46_01251 [Firmicutes bacterium ADurb.Bin300]|nr:MAG: hypothetical protein BWY46_01251 [Firmicutes bacterium ADurb.Bin300]